MTTAMKVAKRVARMTSSEMSYDRFQVTLRRTKNSRMALLRIQSLGGTVSVPYVRMRPEGGFATYVAA